VKKVKFAQLDPKTELLAIFKILTQNINLKHCLGYLISHFFAILNRFRDMAKPEVAAILDFSKKNITSCHLGHFLFENFFVIPNRFRDMAKLEVAAILDFRTIF
jgi:hypothetical protein